MAKQNSRRSSPKPALTAPEQRRKKSSLLLELAESISLLTSLALTPERSASLWSRVSEEDAEVLALRISDALNELFDLPRG